ncbi:MAG: hypothetical protein ACH255_13500 [Candidatus Thiodiazotropha sp.]
MKEISTISNRKVKNKKSAVIQFPDIRCDAPGSPGWLRARGLLLPSDLARDYEFIRKPRGPYAVSLPEDLG